MGGKMFKNQKELYEEIKNKIIEECKNSKFGLTFMDEKFIPFAEQQKWHEQDIFRGLKIDTLQILTIGGKAPELYMVIPWSRKVMLPFEFFSICSGNLPFPLALRTKITKFKWAAYDKKGYHRIVEKLDNNNKFVSGIVWNWSTFEHSGTIDWGIQAAPLNESEYLFIVQTAIKKGPFADKFYLDWFIEKRELFTPIIEDVKSGSEQQLTFIFPTRTALALSKLLPEKLSKYIEKVDKNISAEHVIITEIEYKQIMDDLVEKAVAMFNEEQIEAQEKLIKQKIKEVMKKVIEKNTDDVHKLHRHLMVFKKINSEMLIESKISRELIKKIREKVTGIDEKATNKIGCVIFLILIPLVYLIWVKPLGFLASWLKIFLTIISLVGVGFLQDLMRSKITKKQSAIDYLRE